MEYALTEKEAIAVEELALNAWPAIRTIHHHGCVLRWAKGYTKRANSVNALYKNGDLSELIEYSEEFYRGCDLPVIFKIIDVPSYGELDRTLEQRNYTIVDPTTVKLVHLSDTQLVPHDEVRMEDSFSPKWVDSFIRTNRIEDRRNSIEKVLESISVGKRVASVEKDGNIIAFGFGAIENGYVGFFDIFVDLAHRGSGYGRKIMESILVCAKDDGAKVGYLQVMDNNPRAIKLYESLGFKSAYQYWYRVKM